MLKAIFFDLDCTLLPMDQEKFIENYFPGRPLEHLTTFSTLLNALITQTDYQQAA